MFLNNLHLKLQKKKKEIVAYAGKLSDDNTNGWDGICLSFIWQYDYDYIKTTICLHSQSLFLSLSLSIFLCFNPLKKF